MFVISRYFSSPRVAYGRRPQRGCRSSGFRGVAASAAARARMSATISRVMRLSAPNTKTHSACVAANSRPLVEEPALIQQPASAAATARPGELRYLVMAAPVPHAMDLGRIGKNPIGPVAQDGTVLPARLPQFVDDRHVFVGHVVAAVMVGLSASPCRALRCPR